eukprot:3087471-Rhodomonas_salina.7
MAFCRRFQAEVPAGVLDDTHKARRIPGITCTETVVFSVFDFASSQKSPLTTPEHGMSHAAPNIGSTVVEAFAGAAHVGAAPFTPRIAARLAEVVMDDTSTVGAKQSEHASVAAMPG